MPDSIPADVGIFGRHPELFEFTGLRLAFIPHQMRGRSDDCGIFQRSHYVGKRVK